MIEVVVLIRREELLEARGDSQVGQRINMAELFREPSRVRLVVFLRARKDLQLQHDSLSFQ